MSEKVLSADEVAAMRESIAVRIGPADAPYFPGNEHLHVLRDVLESHEALRALATELAVALDGVLADIGTTTERDEALLAEAREAGVFQ